MRKETAFALLGGTPTTVAKHCKCSRQAVHKWPPILPRRTADSVLAARLRLEWQIARIQANPGAFELPPLVADALEA